MAAPDRADRWHADHGDRRAGDRRRAHRPPDEITAADAVRAGAASLEALRAELARRDGELYRIEFHLAGPDPRVGLRERDELTDEEVDDIGRRLARLDAASSHGPWTTAVLELIAARPAVRAGDLADELGSGAPVVQDRRPQAQGAWA